MDWTSVGKGGSSESLNCPHCKGVCPISGEVVGVIKTTIDRWSKELDGNGQRPVIEIVRGLDRLDIENRLANVEKFIAERKIIEHAIKWIIAPGTAFLVFEKVVELFSNHR